VVAVNLRPEPAECVLPLDVPNLAGRQWRLVDLLGEDRTDAEGGELARRGLPLKLEAFGCHVFELDSRPSGETGG
jgi:hypothetical protein